MTGTHSGLVRPTWRVPYPHFLNQPTFTLLLLSISFSRPSPILPLCAPDTTAAIGKGFAILSSALTSLALLCAFLVRSGATAAVIPVGPVAEPGVSGAVGLFDRKVLAGLVVGSMVPFLFSALTTKTVGVAAKAMVEEVRRQFTERPGLLAENTAERPDYARCVSISTRAALREMVLPGLLVIAGPLVVGTLFGVRALAGFLVGSLLSAAQLAVSMANSGGAWDNAKKVRGARSALDSANIHRSLHAVTL